VQSEENRRTLMWLVRPLSFGRFSLAFRGDVRSNSDLVNKFYNPNERNENLTFQYDVFLGEIYIKITKIKPFAFEI
jgi:hypothetical protein